MVGFSVSDAAWVPLSGIAAGLVLVARGILAYRRALRVSGIATSGAAGIAAGEVRITGEVEAGDTTLVSPLQSLPCVYYRALAARGSGDDRQVVLDEARSVSFRVRDSSGAVTVFPRGARWEVPARLDEGGLLGDTPTGLDLNRGSRFRATSRTREQQIAELLTVHGAPGTGFESASGFGDAGVLDHAGALGGAVGSGDGGSLAIGLEGATSYRESLVAPGDVVTVVGTAVPFAEMPDLAESQDGLADPMDDPEIAADLEAAQAAGLVVGDAAAAWGNAAIPGFGIGKPTRVPTLDPAARPEPAVGSAGPVAADRVERRPEWDLAPDALVVASVAGRPLSIWSGTPEEASARTMGGFWMGLAGAVLAVASMGWLLVGGGV